MTFRLRPKEGTSLAGNWGEGHYRQRPVQERLEKWWAVRSGRPADVGLREVCQFYTQRNRKPLKDYLL